MLYRKSASLSEKLPTAKALAKKPANVMPTWIVAKNLLGSPKRFCNILAFLSPDSAMIFTLLSFNEINAISEAVKKAFRTGGLTGAMGGFAAGMLGGILLDDLLFGDDEIEAAGGEEKSDDIKCCCTNGSDVK